MVPSFIYIITNASIKFSNHFEKMGTGHACFVDGIALAHPAPLPQNIAKSEVIFPIILDIWHLDSHLIDMLDKLF